MTVLWCTVTAPTNASNETTVAPTANRTGVLECSVQGSGQGASRGRMAEICMAGG